jgi:Trypsin-like peptidase domain
VLRFPTIWLGLAVLAALGGCAPAGPVTPAGPQVATLTARFGAVAHARGSAVLLPGGLALTAAHVVDEASLREALCRMGRWPGEEMPYLAELALSLPGSQPVPATRVRLGRSTFAPLGASASGPAASCELAYRQGMDLALLRLAAPLATAPPPPVCATDPIPGQAVLVVSAAHLALARLEGEAAEADAANGRYAVLALRLEQGDSGGGVFDAATGCLLGIVSMRDPGVSGRTWLVRAAVIRAFLADQQGEAGG